MEENICLIKDTFLPSSTINVVPMQYRSLSRNILHSMILTRLTFVPEAIVFPRATATLFFSHQNFISLLVNSTLTVHFQMAIYSAYG